MLVYAYVRRLWRNIVMASPIKKHKAKEDRVAQVLRGAVAQALVENKAHIMLDARPCSIEIGRNAKKELVWNVKIYTLDGPETLDTVSLIRKIENQIEEQFKS